MKLELTESKIKNIIRESVKRKLMESPVQVEGLYRICERLGDLEFHGLSDVIRRDFGLDSSDDITLEDMFLDRFIKKMAELSSECGVIMINKDGCECIPVILKGSGSHGEAVPGGYHISSDDDSEVRKFNCLMDKMSERGEAYRIVADSLRSDFESFVEDLSNEGEWSNVEQDI